MNASVPAQADWQKISKHYGLSFVDLLDQRGPHKNDSPSRASTNSRAHRHAAAVEKNSTQLFQLVSISSAFRFVGRLRVTTQTPSSCGFYCADWVKTVGSI